jgi:phosphohistidine phosphatase
MMRTLVLLRHAKSSWDDPALDDHDRPLNARGRAAAPLIGRALARLGLCPALVIASTAIRVRETLDYVLPFLGARPEIRFEPALYLAEQAVWLARLGFADASVRCVLMAGHEPGLGAAASALSGEGSETAALALLRQKFPTGAAAVLEGSGPDWRAQGRFRLTHFLRPRDLA